MPTELFQIFVDGKDVGPIPIWPPTSDDAYQTLSEAERETVDAYAAEIAFHLNATGLGRPEW